MHITKKIIITDTNIITDLSNANILEKFVNLENVYISDLVKNDEINSKTGDIKVIEKFKVLSATSEQLQESSSLSKVIKKLSPYDILNYILARDNDCILATGDNKLKSFSEKNNIVVFRTLKIIILMKENSVISLGEAIDACKLLKNNPKTRIPLNSIETVINELEKEILT